MFFFKYVLVEGIDSKKIIDENIELFFIFFQI